MARGVNKVILIGNVGNDPDIKATQSGNMIANLSIATSDSWTDKQTGQKQEKTEWHRVVVFGKLAEIVQQYVRKGSKLYIEGKLQTRKWQDQQGADRYTTEVVVDSFGGQMQMLDSRSQTAQGYDGANSPSALQNNHSHRAPANTQGYQQPEMSGYGNQNNHNSNSMATFNAPNAMNQPMSARPASSPPPNNGAMQSSHQQPFYNNKPSSYNQNANAQQKQGMREPQQPAYSYDNFDDDVPF